MSSQLKNLWSKVESVILRVENALKKSPEQLLAEEKDGEAKVELVLSDAQEKLIELGASPEVLKAHADYTKLVQDFHSATTKAKTGVTLLQVSLEQALPYIKEKASADVLKWLADGQSLLVNESAKLSGVSITQNAEATTQPAQY